VELSPVDRDAAIAVLRRRLTPARLRAVIRGEEGPRRRHKGVEWIITETEKADDAAHPTRRRRSRLPDEELAPFLVDLKGADLLASRELRWELADAADPRQLDALHDYGGSSRRGRRGRPSKVNAVADRNWHPGKSWARHFVRSLDLPIALAGIAGPRAEPEILEAEPFRPLPPLEDFQVELRRAVLDVLTGEPGQNRGILTLPTGAGKTRTATEALTAWLQSNPGNALLWIAQSEELCEQAVQAFREVWVDRGARDNPPREPLVVARLWGAGRTLQEDSAVTVASIQKLHAIYRDDPTQLEELAERTGAVVVDEVHRLLAPSYTAVLGSLGVDFRRTRTSAQPLLGLTATPYRGVDEETRALAARFHHRLLVSAVLGDDPVAELRRRCVLSNPVHSLISHGGPRISVSDNPKYAEHFAQFNDFHPDLLKRLGEDVSRNRQLLDLLLAIPADWPTLFFGCSVEQATAVALLLQRAGRSAGLVTASTRMAIRRHRVEQFRAGDLSVLSNYGVLTTGFDAPLVRVVVIARPTASAVLYEQMIGRGMRGVRFGGTDECLVVDVEDNIRFDGQMAYARYASYWTRSEAMTQF
jgi:superfamily II DNA or RNA helicase